MGRPPCCGDKDGIKKGPWTPEEDIILVSYIQEYGPGNWRSVPTNTGLLRCSKSCRLRWTNYLRPGIKRGNFSSHEDGMIIHLQALLGNKWAAIASYLPQRTDNDIKNYWNTHLKKKLNRLQSTNQQQPLPTPHVLGNNENAVTMASSSSCSSSDRVIMSTTTSTTTSAVPASHEEYTTGCGAGGGGYYCRDHDQMKSDLAAAASCCSSLTRILSGASTTSSSSRRTRQPSSSATTYASSTENISRLLEGWMKSRPSTDSCKTSKEVAMQVVQETMITRRRKTNHVNDDDCINYYNHDHQQQDMIMTPQATAAADHNIKAAHKDLLTVEIGEKILATDEEEFESIVKSFNRNLMNVRDKKNEVIIDTADADGNCNVHAAAWDHASNYYKSSSQSNCCTDYPIITRGTESITSTPDHGYYQHEQQGVLISKRQHNHAQIITNRQTTAGNITAASSTAGTTMLLEKWLQLDETSSHVEDIMAMHSLF